MSAKRLIGAFFLISAWAILFCVPGERSSANEMLPRAYLPLIYLEPSIYTLYPVRDTEINQSYNTKNYGTEMVMRTGYDDYPIPPGSMASLLAFDLTHLPEGRVPSQATLFLNINKWDGQPSRTRTLEIFPLLESWEETVVTWYTRPSADSVSVDVPLVSFIDFSYQEIDLTHLVEAWLSGEIANYGIEIKMNSSSIDPFYCGFSTREGEHRPYLVIDYTP